MKPRILIHSPLLMYDRVGTEKKYIQALFRWTPKSSAFTASLGKHKIKRDVCRAAECRLLPQQGVTVYIQHFTGISQDHNTGGTILLWDSAWFGSGKKHVNPFTLRLKEGQLWAKSATSRAAELVEKVSEYLHMKISRHPPWNYPARFNLNFMGQ